MLKWRLRELMGRGSDLTDQKITYDRIHEATGLSKRILSRIGSNQAKRAELETMELLLNYFSEILGEELSTDDLLTLNR